MPFGKACVRRDNFVHVPFRRNRLCWKKANQSGVSDTMKILNWTIPLIAAMMIMVMQPGIGNAASCAEKANSVAAQNGGELLSVATVGSGAAAKCKITILVKSSDGGPARKKTITVPK